MKDITTESGWLSVLRDNKIVGDYVLLNVLGEGRFGLVYKVRHVETDKLFAMKFLKVWSVPQYARQNMIKRFEMEYETGLIPSKYLIQAHLIGDLEGIPYFVMEFCNGGNLERKIANGLERNQALAIALKILEGLSDLHNNGKIHRDLKPENILFDNDDNPKLTDFGISGHMNIQLTVVNEDDKPEQIFGSYAYMAPEQLSPLKRKNTLLPTIDIFSYGVVLYEMITGHLPFGKWEKHEDIAPYLSRAAKGQFDPVENHHIDLPEQWNAVLNRCLVANREYRFQRVDEILEIISPSSNQERFAVQCRPVFKLKVLDGEDYGKVYHLKIQNILKLGRMTANVDNDVQVTETISSYISRKHATFERLQEKVYLRDGQWSHSDGLWVSSKNGTYINGEMIEKGKSRVLRYNDVITIGNTSIKILDA